MADPGQLRIQNDSNYYLTYQVTNNGWNCCDLPERGFSVGPIAPNTTSDYFTFVRKDGHGCDGRQGIFQFVPVIQTAPALPQGFTFDSNGSIAFEGTKPNYASQLIDEGSKKYTWKVTLVEKESGEPNKEKVGKVVTWAQVDSDVFQTLMKKVVELRNGISTDEGEWDKYAEICNDAATKGIGTYNQRCSKELWTDGEDRFSWSAVKQAAETAAKQNRDDDALITILKGFFRITAPSHNSGQWAALLDLAMVHLRKVDTFHALMIKVIELRNGISTDEGEWDKYAVICRDAVVQGIGTYIQRCSKELWTNGEDQFSWSAVKQAAETAAKQNRDDDALMTILKGFFRITAPSHNSGQWVELSVVAANHICVDGSTISFSGTDTRRDIPNPSLLPKAMSSSFVLKKGELPAHYTEIAGQKTCHVEYFMRLNITDNDGSAYFIMTHSQDDGGYVALAKVAGENVGKVPRDHEITVLQPKFAGEVVWWDHLEASHPGGCNHPGNGGQVGAITVLVGQDWTKTYPVIGHAVKPVGKGSKVLFYDFSSLKAGKIPTMGLGSKTSDAYLGCLTTQELGLRAGDDGEVSSVNFEQGPDGMYYLIAGNKYQTVVWKSAELVPKISKWMPVEFWGTGNLNDGSSQLAWSSYSGKKSLYYVTSGHNGMSFRELKYEVIGGKVVSVYVEPKASFATSQSDRFGDGDWVADNGSIYVGASQGIALFGAYKSINDGPYGSNDLLGSDSIGRNIGFDTSTKESCIQVRAWYSPPRPR